MSRLNAFPIKTMNQAIMDEIIRPDRLSESQNIATVPTPKRCDPPDTCAHKPKITLANAAKNSTPNIILSVVSNFFLSIPSDSKFQRAQPGVSIL